MLNKDRIRELAYTVVIDRVEPIEGKDRVESAVVGGWTCMVPKGQFHPGDIAVYFEIDSKVPELPVFEFLAKRNYKIKTQKFKAGEGHYFSQGLVMGIEDFDGALDWIHEVTSTEPIFLTKELGVTYAETEDNRRKGASADKYKIMAQRHPKVFKNRFVRWLMRRTWGKRLLFLLFGRGTKKKVWPSWVVKTDEERIQNLVSRIPEFRQEKWIATEKIDGTSTTFTMRVKDKKLIVCSRNVVMNQPGKKKTCYYAETDGNVYVEMAQKYDMYNVLKSMIKDFVENEEEEVEYITLQGETYGGSIQKRHYKDNHDLAIFNVIIGYKFLGSIRLNPEEGRELMGQYGLPYVPVIGEVELPETCEEILAMAGGPSAIDGGMREGLVFRNYDGTKSFKAVDNEFLAKYHG